MTLFAIFYATKHFGGGTNWSNVRKPILFLAMFKPFI